MATFDMHAGTGTDSAAGTNAATAFKGAPHKPGIKYNENASEAIASINLGIGIKSKPQSFLGHSLSCLNFNLPSK